MEETPEKTASFAVPKIVYHGSVNGEIKEFEPRSRFTPSSKDVGPRVYASANPAFAAAHAWPWHSAEGIDVKHVDGQMVLEVPERHKERLDQEVYIYSLPANSFELTTEEETGETVHSTDHVTPESVTKFDSVTEAVEHFGGRVEIIP